jgi:hypothetical protein
MADGEIDMSAALAQMSEGLLGGGGDDPGDAGGQETGTSPPPSPGAPIASPAVAPATPSAWDAPPKAWKQDMHPHWQSLNPDVRKYLYDREDQAFKGITEARKLYDPYDGVNKKFSQWFEQYKIPGEQLPQVYERMIGSHLTLMHAPDEVKKAAIQALVRDYKLEDMLRSMFGGQQPSGQPQQPFVDPMKLLQEVVTPIREQLGNFQQRFQEREQKEAMDAINSFMADPKFEFAKELIPDMTQLLQAGAADGLEQAYEKAKWQNPAVRAKLIAKEIEATTQPKAPARKVVASGTTPPRPTSPKGTTIEDTMNQVMANIQSRQ